MTRPISANVGSTMLPVRGVDFRMPITLMPPEYSPLMTNMISHNGVLVKRPSHTVAVTNSSVNNYPMVIPYFNGTTTQSILLGNSVVTDGSTTNSCSASIYGYTDWCLFRSTICIADGDGTVKLLNPTTLASTSGPIFNPLGSGSAVRRPITSYNERLYIAEDYNLIYTAAGAAALANVDISASVFTLNNVINRPIFGLGTLAVNTGNEYTQVMVIVSQIGEVAIYSGANPSAGTWGLIQKIKTEIPPAPVSSFGLPLEVVEVPGDLLICSKTGHHIYSVKDLLVNGKSASSATFIDPLRPLIRRAGTCYKSVCYWPEEDMIVIAVYFPDTDADPFMASWEGQLGFDTSGHTGMIFALVQRTTGDMTIHTSNPIGLSFSQLSQPLAQMRAAGDVVLYPSDDRAIRLFTRGNTSYADYSGSAFKSIISHAPLQEQSSRKKLSGAALYSSFNSNNSLTMAIKKDYNTLYASSGTGSPTSLSTASTDGASGIITRNILPSAGDASTFIYQLFEQSAYNFEHHGIEPIYESGGIY